MVERICGKVTKITQNNGYYAIQGHRCRYQSKARIWFPITNPPLPLPLLTDILSRNVSKLSQIILQILHAKQPLRIFDTLFGEVGA